MHIFIKYCIGYILLSCLRGTLKAQFKMFLSEAPSERKINRQRLVTLKQTKNQGRDGQKENGCFVFVLRPQESVSQLFSSVRNRSVNWTGPHSPLASDL